MSLKYFLPCSVKFENVLALSSDQARRAGFSFSLCGLGGQAPGWGPRQRTSVRLACQEPLPRCRGPRWPFGAAPGSRHKAWPQVPASSPADCIVSDELFPVFSGWLPQVTIIPIIPAFESCRGL